MRKPFLFCSRYVIGLFVFVFALLFITGTDYGQELGNPGALKARTGEKGVLANKARERFRAALETQSRHTKRLMDILGVVGTGTGIDPDGKPVIRVFTSRRGIREIPGSLDGIPVRVKMTGRYYALADPPPDYIPTDRWPRPVPIGVSTGHPSITAGTIGARVTDGANVFALSNNHVYADVNMALLGDKVLQPGTFDGGVDPEDAIGTLYDYEPIEFCDILWFWAICNQVNEIDAAMALSSLEELGNSTPSYDENGNEGYGVPNSLIFGDSDADGFFDERNDLLGLPVQKFGRTTGMTYGQISEVNATVDVCYDDACQLVARFVDQLIIAPETFSAGGDSGSLIVTRDENKNPVGLLFAGSSASTVANRIDLVLDRFAVDIDSGPTPDLMSITVTPEIPPEIEVGQTVQFTAMGTYSDDSTLDLTEPAVWSCLPQGVASIDSSGLATGVGPGEAAITATHAGVSSDPVALTVTASSVTLESISVSPVNVTIEVGEARQFAATGTFSDDSTVDLTESAEWSCSPASVATMESPGLAIGVGEGMATITATQGAVTSNEATLEVTAAVSGGPHLRTGKVWASSANWEEVTLDHNYEDMVVVCTANYDEDPYGPTKMPAVPHVRNASGDSFEVRLVQAVGGAFEISAAEVHWVAVEAGTYNETDHGVKMEAAKFSSTVTDWARSWVGQSRVYGQQYTNPVVVGQVMSLNSYDTMLGFDLWSVFWSRGSSRSNPPSSNSLWLGKHVGEDPRYRDIETVGYIVIEAGSGSIDSTNYVAGLGSDTIRGVGNAPPYIYSFTGLTNPSTAILSQAAMDGGNGGWAILYGNNPITMTELRIAVDEDWAIDTERRHTAEQVAYIVFE